MNLNIRQYDDRDREAVIELWRKCDLIRPENDPAIDIARKVKVNRELFLVGEVDGKVIASVMGGYEGHRGWVNYLAVDPEYRKKGFGRHLMHEIEKTLHYLGCPKINLQVRNDNREAMAFYEKIGYGSDNVVSYGKRLRQDS